VTIRTYCVDNLFLLFNMWWQGVEHIYTFVKEDEEKPR